MATTNATILIPDISGFTEFMTTTELNHSTLAINMLIDAMIKAIGNEYEVAEIEGDAVLLVRKSRRVAIQLCATIKARICRMNLFDLFRLLHWFKA